MALKQCNECKKEISTTVTVCPNCGSKRPFRGVKLSREETKELSSEERKSFEKAGGKVTIGIFEKLWKGTLAIFIIIVVVSSIDPKSSEEIQKMDNKKQKEMEELAETVKTIPAVEIDKNRKVYEQLSKYYPKNKLYKEKLLKYDNLKAIEIQCEIDSRKKNRLQLKYPNTFESIVMDEYEYTKWINSKTIIHQSSFYGKNAFGVKQRLVKKYKCIVTGDNTFTITSMN